MTPPGVRIVRVEDGPDGVFGVLLVNDKAVAVTLEDPDRNDDGIPGNEKNQSCIPAGVYAAIRVVSPKFGPTFMIVGVPGRDKILFHAGNTSADTQGCILVGSGYLQGPGIRGIGASKEAFRSFMERFRDVQGFDVDIQWA